MNQIETHLGRIFFSLSFTPQDWGSLTLCICDVRSHQNLHNCVFRFLDSTHSMNLIFCFQYCINGRSQKLITEPFERIFLIFSQFSDLSELSLVRKKYQIACTEWTNATHPCHLVLVQANYLLSLPQRTPHSSSSTIENCQTVPIFLSVASDNLK